MSFQVCKTCHDLALTFSGECADCYGRRRDQQRQPAETFWFTNERRGTKSRTNSRGNALIEDDTASAIGVMQALEYGDFGDVPDFCDYEQQPPGRSVAKEHTRRILERSR